MVVLTRKHATNDISRLEKAEKSIAPMARLTWWMRKLKTAT